MKSNAYNVVVLAGMLVQLVLSCSPYPNASKAPGIQIVDVAVDTSSINLSALLDCTEEQVTECGFMYGTNDEDMIKIISTLHGDTFDSCIEDFLYDTKYQLYAYISNGRNVIRTDYFTFMTPAHPELEPEPEPEPKPEPEPEPVKTFEFSLPYNQLIFAPSINLGYTVTVFGNVKYEVMVPDDCNWIRVDTESTRNCYFYVKANCTEEDRTCDLVFSSLDHDCQQVLKVIQKHQEIHTITKSYENTNFDIVEDFEVFYSCIVDDNGENYSCDWCYALSHSENMTLVHMDENNTGEPRQVILNVRLSSDCSVNKLYRLVQNPKFPS